ncbi:MAG: DUF3298 and DUF4163 domain-containing protein [Chlorobium sp.]|uniref:DUF3298 and DUF4163 domain-containing protein n=1 Tax=Chlorobium sp. TaxID=1095 RepID=UPI0025C1C16C|nr:DUF3298 and DUF4163 domain-containing protein [Chlorobium sp.]MCF8216362.1 DUF3298 and DUF4163 domain-containing protein [Chlorobium sp.]MCF8271265.1 DUF3298 and DUF4163 domain-containing protein [Chlorobium sp.]MCF8287639.1 DUF3298 and DUF4163 domain-containing protein [Chlorobium sp.]MCF8291178.1 DUF3298 and DUF4163 domain-containing protein [Chlorobium sp.]MCF8385273.1 DUF3298 and DUF4163 domain-containing protein [Chlorobium sp.]
MYKYNRTFFLFLAGIMIIASACGPNDARGISYHPAGSGISDTLSYSMLRVEKSYGNRKAANEQVAYCKCEYPVFSGGTPAENINATLQSWITDSTEIAPGEGYRGKRSIWDLADNFLGEYERERKERESVPAYQFDLNGSVLLNRQGVLTVSLSTQSYTGGAHGSYGTRFFVFDVRSGKRLGVEDLFIAGFEDRLNSLIDSRYRQMRGLSKTERLDGEKGRLFENGIRFNGNVALTPEGVTFFYNNYEIAAYVYGSTAIALSFRDVEDILKQEFRSL